MPAASDPASEKEPKHYDPVPPSSYARVAKICLALPETENKPFGGHTSPAYRVRDKIFCGTRQVGRPSIQLKGRPGAQEALVASDPARFYVPEYVGNKGWIGIYVDVDQDWGEVAELIEESYRMVAPKTLVKLLDPR